MRKLNQLFLAVMTAMGMMLFATPAQAQVEAAEIYCTIRDTGTNLNCQWVGKDARKSMSADDIVQYIDRAEVAAYLSVKSRRGFERVFFLDPESPQFRKLGETKKTGSISEISKAKNDLFAEIEKRAIKISDDLDAMTPTMELVKYDASVGVEKYKRDLRRLDNELVSVTGTNPNQAFEQGGNAGSDTGGKPRWELAIGMGYNTVVNVTGLSTSTFSADSTIGAFSGNLYATHAWGPLWSSELEVRALMPADYGRGPTSGAFAKVNSAGTYVNLKTYRSFGDYDLGINVMQNGFVTANGANKYQFDPATFVALAYNKDFKFGRWTLNTALALGSGVTLPQASRAAGTTKDTATSGTIAEIEFNIVNQFTRSSSLSMQLNFDYMAMTYPATGAPTGQTAQTNTQNGFIAYYKYSWF